MNKFRNFIKRWLGWVVIVPTIYLILMGESEMWLVLIICLLLKIPPFDWIGRAMDWAAVIGVYWGLKMRSWKEKQNKPIQVIVTIVAIIIILLLWWFMPECELC